MQEARVNFAALRLSNGKVMVSGGFSHGHKGTRSCEILDESQQVSAIPHMTQARIAHSMCQLGEYVYAFGGMLDSSKILGSVERWRMHSDKWEFMCEMPQPLCFVGLVPDKGRILVLGGNRTNELASKVFSYDGKAMFSLAGTLDKADSFPHSAPH